MKYWTTTPILVLVILFFLGCSSDEESCKSALVGRWECASVETVVLSHINDNDLSTMAIKQNPIYIEFYENDACRIYGEYELVGTYSATNDGFSLNMLDNYSSFNYHYKFKIKEITSSKMVAYINCLALGVDEYYRQTFTFKKIQ